VFKLIRLTWVPVALMLSACDVQVHDETPAEYPAKPRHRKCTHIKATVTRDTLVSPGSWYSCSRSATSEDSTQPGGLRVARVVFGALSEQLPLQILAEWKTQAFFRAPPAGRRRNPGRSN